MNQIQPEQFKFEETEERKDKDGRRHTKTTKLSFDTEDLIAAVAGLIAVLFAIAMVFGTIPINELTIGVAGLSGAGAVIAKILQARKKGTTEP